MTTSNPPVGKTPREILALDISERLIAAGLIHSSKRETIERGLTTGSLRSEDWALLVETAEEENERR